jgi:thiopurine S-methyltransferase
MHREFWLERWQNNEIGFHSDSFNPHLLHYWPQFALPPGSSVLVPLCGKSRDMLWLREQKAQVIGVELSPLAITAFCEENQINTDVITEGPFTISRGDRIALYGGDFFELGANQLADVQAVYDRAALVALPADLRKNYVAHLRKHLSPGVAILLLTFDYDQQEMAGPPFSVQPQEVEALYGDWCEIVPLFSAEILEREPRFRARGLTGLHEHVFALTVQ